MDFNEIQAVRETSPIIVSDDYLCYKEQKKSLQLFSCFSS